MPRPRPPPTPSSSTDLGAESQDRNKLIDSAFALPPPAMNRSPPTSPNSLGLQRKRTLSGAAKSKADALGNVDLPPPPSRARKIIQMKPKHTEEASSPSTPTTASKAPPTPSPKRKQPSATSAAGRKIARKTAHSIIERRRRSKMNEEFGVLKDMIPACNGVEMHKLAILQAGIEYVRYLQGCVDRLSAGHSGSPIQDEEDRMEAEQQKRPTEKFSPSSDDEMHHHYRRGSIVTTTTSSTHPSPPLRPNMSSSSLTSQNRVAPALLHATYSTSPPPLAAQTPTPTGVSPAFNAIHFSPDLSRASTFNFQQAFSLSGKPSPNILPLPQLAIPMSERSSISQPQPPLPGEGAAEATATAALMMLTNDRRSARGGMSVKDLLSG